MNDRAKDGSIISLSGVISFSKDAFLKLPPDKKYILTYSRGEMAFHLVIGLYAEKMFSFSGISESEVDKLARSIGLKMAKTSTNDYIWSKHPITIVIGGGHKEEKIIAEVAELGGPILRLPSGGGSSSNSEIICFQDGGLFLEFPMDRAEGALASLKSRAQGGK